MRKPSFFDVCLHFLWVIYPMHFMGTVAGVFAVIPMFGFISLSSHSQLSFRPNIRLFASQTILFFSNYVFFPVFVGKTKNRKGNERREWGFQFQPAAEWRDGWVEKKWDGWRKKQPRIGVGEWMAMAKGTLPLHPVDMLPFFLLIILFFAWETVTNVSTKWPSPSTSKCTFRNEFSCQLDEWLDGDGGNVCAVVNQIHIH